MSYLVVWHPDTAFFMNLRALLFREPIYAVQVYGITVDFLKLRKASGTEDSYAINSSSILHISETFFLKFCQWLFKSEYFFSSRLKYNRGEEAVAAYLGRRLLKWSRDHNYAGGIIHPWVDPSTDWRN